VRHRNNLPVPTAVHLHGGHTLTAHDGYPTDLVLPVGTPVGAMPGMRMGPDTTMGPADPSARVASGSRDYVYPLRQRAATLWYHDHRMGFTARACGTAWPASSSSATTRRTGCRCRAATGTCRR